MLKKVKNISKKITTLIIIFAMILMYMPQFPLTVYAADNVSSLNTPINLRWKEGSTATATWDVVENANYYNVTVNVYNDSELLGTRITGTGTNEIDLQQEINDINYDYKLSKLYVTFIVQAVYESDNANVLSSCSEESVKYIIEKKGTIKLPTPTNVAIDEDYNLTWNMDTASISNIDYFNVFYKFKYNNSVKTGYLGLFNPTSSPTRDPEFGMTITNGKATANLKNKLSVKYKEAGYDGQMLEVSFYVVAAASNNSPIYLNSNDSEYSNIVNYKNEGIIKLPTPTNVVIDENYNLTWNIDTASISNIDYFNVFYKFKYNNSVKTGYLGLFNPKSSPTRDPEFGMTITNGKATANLKNKLSVKYKEVGYNGQIIEASFYVIASASNNSSTYLNSNNSEYSNSVNYKNEGITKLPTPTNVAIDEDYNLTWNMDTASISNIDYFNVFYKFKYNNSVKTGYLGLFNPTSSPTRDPEFGMTITNGKATANLKNKLSVKYKEVGYNGQIIEASFYVIALPANNSSTYLNSNNSEYSNSVYYTSAGSTKINLINLSPSKPVIAVGRTMYIGKTIDPDNAYYSSINWTTSNSSIVSINNMGQITGIKKGNATISAQINNATQTAEVSVYEIETNIANNTEANNVLNEANNVIEAVTTNGDITNTDIVDKATVINEIETAAENGDKFNVGITYDSKAANSYNDIKDEINTKFDGFNIIGGSDIKIEISHKDNSGRSHHIANITELEDNVSVQFDMKSKIPQKPRNMSREYKLVRCHDNNIEEIDFEMNNGVVETSSNKFSDFILVYKDQELPTYSISGEITSYKSNTDDISIQLYESDSTECIYEEKVQGNSANYTITDVPVGTYTLKFVKANHTAREYSVTIDNSNTTLNANLNLLGDINGDGKTNMKDWNRMYDHINETNALTGYEFSCADVNGDGKVNMKDWNRVYDHINETDLLY